MHICVCVRLSEIPDDPSEVNCKVSGNFLVEDWCAGFECLFRVRHDIQRLIIDLNEVKCIIPNGKLLRHHDDNPLTGKAYFVVSEDGTPYHPESVSDAFDRAVKAAGAPRIPFRNMRHTHATLGLKAGVPLKVMSKRLGHSSIAITADIYQHVIEGMDREAATAIGALIYEPEDPSAIHP